MRNSNKYNERKRLRRVTLYMETGAHYLVLDLILNLEVGSWENRNFMFYEVDFGERRGDGDGCFLVCSSTKIMAFAN